MNAVQQAQSVLATLAEQGVACHALSNDSRRVQAGDVFIAMPGTRHDPRKHLQDVVMQGAVAIIYENGDGFVPTGLPVPVVGVAGLSRLQADLAAAVYQNPSRRLWMVGVTGTNGKTTVTQWLGQALERLSVPCGVIGTLGYGRVGQPLNESANTTPDALSVQRALADFVDHGVQAVAMEVSSVGVAQGRVDRVQFAVAVFTNLSRDHLDYHHTMEAYAAAKAAFFEWPDLRAAVINIDDPWGLHLVARTVEKGVPVLATSLSAQQPMLPQGVSLLQATRIAASGTGLAADLLFQGQHYELAVDLLGRFNLSNMLQVLGCLILKNVPIISALEAVKGLIPPAGRMQSLGGLNQPLVVIDYAHTPDALEKVLIALRETAVVRQGRLICVFGCGGDRDPGKRPLMGQIAAEAADAVWVTSDNPRTESPEAIIQAVMQGVEGAAGERVQIQSDRAKAIFEAIVQAKTGDVILLAGKGHEPYQEIAGQRYAFSDRTEADKALAYRASGGKK